MTDPESMGTATIRWAVIDKVTKEFIKKCHEEKLTKQEFKTATEILYNQRYMDMMADFLEVTGLIDRQGQLRNIGDTMIGRFGKYLTDEDKKIFKNRGSDLR